MSSMVLDPYSKLPEEEFLRLQKILGVILPFEKRDQQLRLYIRNSFKSMGSPFIWLKIKSQLKVFCKLLSSWGVLEVEDLDNEERCLLEANPYTIWPSPKICKVNVDSFEFLLQDTFFKNKNFLGLLLLQLSPREKKDWCHWLNLELPSLPSERSRTLWFYRCLSVKNYLYSNEIIFPDSPKDKINPFLIRKKNYLDEFFPNDLGKSQMAWFYNGVLSFYRALEECEKQLKFSSNHVLPISREAALRCINDFKVGKLFLKCEISGPIKERRWLIVNTRENMYLSLRKSTNNLKNFLSFELYLGSN